MNTAFGFGNEVRIKYGHGFYRFFSQVFDLLPLATLIAGEVLVLHGGLPRKSGCTLDHIKMVDHRRNVPDSPTRYQDVIFYDILWADPRARNGVGPNERGGSTITFGPDISRDFMQKNGLKHIFRSHEVPSTMQGFENHHEGRVVTIFSASNYCGDHGNFGGVAEFFRTKGRVEYKIHEHWAPPLADIEKEAKFITGQADKWRRTLERAFEGKASAREQHRASVLSAVATKVVAKKQDILWYFSKLDPDNSGWISIDEWRQGMDAVLDLKVSYKEYQDDLVEPQDGWVNYARFCRRYRVAFATVQETKWQAEARRALYEAVMGADLSTAEALEVFADESMSDSQLAKAIESRLRGSSSGLSFPQLETVVQHVRQSGGGKAKTAAEFAEHFAAALSLGSPRSNETLKALGALLHSHPGSSTALFAQIDTNADGFISYEEFVTAVMDLQRASGPGGKAMDEAGLRKVCEEIDVGGHGHVNYLEFCAAFYSEEHADMVAELMLQLHTTFYENKIGLRRAFRYFDVDEDGTVTPAELKAGLTALNSLLSKHGKPISESQIGAIAAHLDRNDDGKIDYSEFIDGFRVVDAETGRQLSEGPIA